MISCFILSLLGFLLSSQLLVPLCSPVTVHWTASGRVQPAMQALRSAAYQRNLSKFSCVIAPTPHVSRPPQRTQHVRCMSLLNKLFGGSSAKQADMGNKHGKGWAPSSAGSTERKVSQAGFDITPLTAEEKAREAQKLTGFQRHVTLEAGTERPFTGKTVDGTPHDAKVKGTYVSAISGLPLFSSDCKFDSGTGWPSFYAPVSPDHVIEEADNTLFMSRVEVLDAKSGAHLGHVFDDGPRPTGKRYCMNAAALRFIPEGEPLPHRVQE